MNDTNSRRAGIGSSDAPVIAGLSPWRTPVELWQEKLGTGGEQEKSLPMRAGNALEALVIEAFTEETGLDVINRQHRFVDRDWPVRWATVDGITTGNALVEAKTDHSADEWGEPGTDEIPPHYVLQVQHAMACTQSFIAYVPVLINLRELRIYQVHRDDRIVATLTDMERRFWEHCLQRTAPPMLRPADLKLIYPRASNATAVATVAVQQTLEALRKQVAHAAALKKDIERWKAEIQSFMGEAGALNDVEGKVLATWLNTKPIGRFDEEALKAEHPDIWAKFRRAGASQRRFLIKGVKGNGDE